MNINGQTSDISYIGNQCKYCEDKKPNIRERLREYGIKYVSNKELLMLLIGTGIKGFPVEKLADTVLKILEKTDSDSLIEKMLGVRGLGTSKATLLAAALELGRRLYGSKGVCIKSPLDVIPLVQHYALEKQEHFLCITLTGANEIIKIRVITAGILNSTLIHPREIFAEAIKDRSAAIILCHNHPSGNSAPSVEDFQLTRRLVKVADIIGIKILDHVIISRNGYYSFRSDSDVIS